jgi:hypothetical protein
MSNVIIHNKYAHIQIAQTDQATCDGDYCGVVTRSQVQTIASIATDLNEELPKLIAINRDRYVVVTGHNNLLDFISMIDDSQFLNVKRRFNSVEISNIFIINFHIAEEGLIIIT